MANVHPISDWQEDPADAVERSYARPAARPAPQFHFPSKEVVAVMAALAGILGVRLGLILSGVGAFLLAQTAMQTGNIGALSVFTLTVFAPMVWLSSAQRV